MVKTDREPPKLRLRSIRLLLFLVGLTTTGTPALAQPGALDPSFGFFGAFVSRSLPWWAAGVRALELQDDGKLVAVGVPFARLTRYRADGQIDLTFGNQGRVAQRAGTAAALDVAIQPDGRILALDEFSGLNRYTRDGKADLTFGFNGIADLSPEAFLCGMPSHFEASSVALQRDGKILVVGTLSGTMFNGRSSWTCDRDFAVVRLNRDGSSDEHFGHAGLATVDFGERWGMAQDVTVERDGSILLGGSSCAVTGQNGGNHTFTAFCAPDETGVVVRLTPTGIHDERFASGGIATIANGQRVHILTVTPLANGKIVVLANTPDGSFVSRLAATGAIDDHFGDDGVAKVPGVVARDLAIDRMGRVVVVGTLQSRFGIVRFLRRGTIDRGFGFGGVVATVDHGEAHSVVVQNDGAIVVAGQVNRGQDALVRLLGGQ